MNYRQNMTPGCHPMPHPMPASTAPVCENICTYPIAMAYVPWQKFGNTYELEKAFRTGTIFPELDQPFMRARCRER